MLKLIRTIAALALTLSFASSAHAVCNAHTQIAQAVEIGHGHAFAAHQAEFQEGVVIAGLAYPGPSIGNADQFSILIRSIMANPSQNKALINNRHAYWDNATGAVVILNMNANDCGTAFRPNAGIAYYNNLN